MSEPLVSVIIPSYNSAAYLPATLESVLGQDYSAVEVVVVDDGSTDDTEQVVHPYRSRIEYIRQENSGGPARPRNVGMEAARGELVALFDSDDVMLPGKLSRSAAVLQALPEVDLLFTDFQVIDENGLVKTPRFLATYRRFRDILEPAATEAAAVLHGPGLYRELLRANFIGTSSVVARRAVLLAEGGFDESLLNSDDRDLWFRLAWSGRRFAFRDEVLHSYRQRAGSVTGNVLRRMPSVIAVLEKQGDCATGERESRLLASQLRRARFTYAWSLAREGDFAGAEKIYCRLQGEQWSWQGFRGLWRSRLRRWLSG